MKERKFINENIKRLLVTEYIKKETDSAGFGGMEMKRNLMDTSIRLVVNKPGLVIGRRGSKVQEIEETLRRRFQIEAPRIEVMEVKNPDLNPQIISKKIAMSLEKGWAYRKAGNTALRRIIESDARGVMIKIGGKISGERARSQKFFYGSIKYSGEPARSGIGYGYSVAKLKLGVIGVTVRLLNKEYRLPDDIIVRKENLKKGVISDVGAQSEVTDKHE
ncbi:MAG: 30S ribosomal protein S3 [Candidatus Thermoplasmatota archaeon]|nr:30S ribosomal protein S3 [Candidatus Thermoplasmatota archaeon]